MAVVVRKAAEQDIDAISSLNADVQAIHAAALPWLFKPAEPGMFKRAGLADILARDGNLVFIAELDSAAAGYAYAQIVRREETPFHHPHDMVFLHHIGVRPACRRAGVGTALIAAVRAAASEHDIANVALDVWLFNDAAREFFRRQGFVASSERMWTR